jgi:hypothetical protein
MQPRECCDREQPVPLRPVLSRTRTCLNPVRAAPGRGSGPRRSSPFPLRCSATSAIQGVLLAIMKDERCEIQAMISIMLAEDCDLDLLNVNKSLAPVSSKRVLRDGAKMVAGRVDTKPDEAIP